MQKKILFICTGNAGRSQMAEAMFRKRYGDKFEIVSAGVEPWDELHPMTIKLMNEDGVDMTEHYPKHIKKYIDDKIDLVVTIGDRAEAESGYFRTKTLRIHWSINDPADADGTDDSEQVFRCTRQAILNRFPELLNIADSLDNSHDTVWQPGVSTGVFRPCDDWKEAAFHPSEHIPMLKKAGFKTIELCCYMGNMGTLDFDWKNSSKVDELAKVAVDHGISVSSVHTPELRLCSEDKADSEKLDVLKCFIEISMKLNSRLMVTHYFPDKDDHYNKKMPEILLELDSLVCDKPLVIGLETLQQKDANSKLISLFKYLNPSSFGSVLDTGHCNIAGDLNRMACTLGKSLKGLHLHDNDSLEDKHLSIGKGVIKWHEFANSLIEAEYEGSLTLESHRFSSDIYSFLQSSRRSLDVFLPQKI